MECVYSLCEPKPARAELLRVLRPGGTLLLADLFAEQPLPADATRAALVGRLSTKAQLEAGISAGFFSDRFLQPDAVAPPVSASADALWRECALSAEDRACLRSVKPGYGLWIWKKS